MIHERWFDETLGSPNMPLLLFRQQRLFFFHLNLFNFLFLIFLSSRCADIAHLQMKTKSNQITCLLIGHMDPPLSLRLRFSNILGQMTPYTLLILVLLLILRLIIENKRKSLFFVFIEKKIFYSYKTFFIFLAFPFFSLRFSFFYLLFLVIN